MSVLPFNISMDRQSGVTSWEDSFLEMRFFFTSLDLLFIVVALTAFSFRVAFAIRSTMGPKVVGADLLGPSKSY